MRILLKQGGRLTYQFVVTVVYSNSFSAAGNQDFHARMHMGPMSEVLCLEQRDFGSDSQAHEFFPAVPWMRKFHAKVTSAFHLDLIL